MLRTRVIPCLLLKNKGLVKTVKFKNEKYVGDPINAVKIFNDKEVDELVFLDIEASKKGNEPDFEFLKKITREAFMPMGYGGGITNTEQIRNILYLGFEKVILNSIIFEKPEIILEASKLCGNQSIVVSIDVKKNIFGKYKVYSHKNNKKYDIDPVDMAIKAEKSGAGELIINSVDNDGMMKGYDTELIKLISEKVNIPVVAIGGAGKIDDLVDAVNIGKASAVSAGSMFVFHGPHKAVLINYPNKKELEKRFEK